jgi:cbb3-type cytochrome oxidase subunit 1
MIGMLLYVFAMYTSGVTQGMMWRSFDSTGHLTYPDFMETVVQIIPMYWVRFFGGTLYLSGVVMLMINMYKTIRTAPEKPEDTVVLLPIASH